MKKTHPISGSRKSVLWSSTVLLCILLFWTAAMTPAYGYISVWATAPSVCVGSPVQIMVDTDCVDLENPAGTTPCITGVSVQMSYVGPDGYGGYIYQGYYATQSSDAGEYLQISAWNDCDEADGPYPVAVIAAQTVMNLSGYDDDWVNNQVSLEVVTVPQWVSCPCVITWEGDGVAGQIGYIAAASYETTGSKTATANVGSSSASRSVTVHQLVSTTQATLPANVHRTLIGIGEFVDIAPDPAVACYWDPPGAPDELTKTQGPTTTLMAGCTETTPVIAAHLVDSGGPTATISYHVETPASENYLSDMGILDPFRLMPQGPPNNYIGNCHEFKQTILSSDVNFYNVTFQEQVPGGWLYWPAGQEQKYPKTKTFSVLDGDGAPNICYDTVGDDGPFSIRILYNSDNIQEPFSWTINPTLCYLDDNQYLIPFAQTTHTRSYTPTCYIHADWICSDGAGPWQ